MTAAAPAVSAAVVPSGDALGNGAMLSVNCRTDGGAPWDLEAAVFSSDDKARVRQVEPNPFRP